MWELWKREKVPDRLCLRRSWGMKDTGWKCWGKSRNSKSCFTTRPWAQFGLFAASPGAQTFLTTPTLTPLGRGSSWQWRSASTWSGTTWLRSSMGWSPPRRSCSAWWGTCWTLARGELGIQTLGKKGPRVHYLHIQYWCFQKVSLTSSEPGNSVCHKALGGCFQSLASEWKQKYWVKLVPLKKINKVFYFLWEKLMGTVHLMSRAFFCHVLSTTPMFKWAFSEILLVCRTLSFVFKSFW